MKKEYKADLIAKENPRWNNVKDGLPVPSKFVRWLTADGIILYRALVSMTDKDMIGRNATNKYKCLYWRNLKIKKVDDEK